MLNLTPQAIKLISYYEDGEDTRHLSFKLMSPRGIETPRLGQFFMLYVPGAGSAPFTFLSQPDKNGLFDVLVKRVGSVSSVLFSHMPGAILGITGPFGKGWPVEKFKTQRLLVIGGGCGLAPLVGLTDYLIDQHYCAELALLYSASSIKTQVLNKERARWQQQIPVFNVLSHAHSADGRHHHASIEALDEVFASFTLPPTTAVLCGPEIMTTAIARALVNRGFKPTSIWISIERRMHCAVGLCGHCYLEHQYACKDGPSYSWHELQKLTSPQQVTTVNAAG